MKLTATVAAVAAGVILFAGCASTPGQADSDATAKTNATSEPAAAPAPTAPEPEPAPAAPSVLKLGQAFTWEDGVTAIITGIADRTISQSYDPQPAKVVTVQVQNGSTGVLELALATLNATFGPAGVPGDAGYDVTGANAGLGLTGSIPPGGTQTAEYFFVNVADASVINVEFSPTWEHQSAFWTAP